MKKVLSLLMAFIMVLSAVQCLSVMSFAAGSTYRESEPNDQRKQADTIVPGRVCIGSTGSRSDVDWYKFRIDSNTDYFTFKLWEDDNNLNPIGYGWKISLYQENSDTSLEICYDGDESPRLPYTGVFYLKVEPKDHSTSNAPIDCTYDLEVTQTKGTSWENEPNGARKTATKINVEKKYQGITTSRSDVDWYTFKIDSNTDYFTFKLQENDNNLNPIGYGWKISLYQENSDTSLKICYDGEESPRLPYTGVFYLKVEPKDHSTSNAPIDCTYDIEVLQTKGSSWENEPNNTQKTATKIMVGNQYYGITTNRTDVDWYRVKICNNSSYFRLLFGESKYSMEALGYGWKVSLYKEGSSKAIKVWDDLSQSPALAYKGTFYIKVEPNDKSTSNAPIDCYYDLKVIADKSHSFKTTTTKATTTKDGKRVAVCKYCSEVGKTVVIPKASSCKLSATSFTYDGKVKTPSVTVKTSKGTTLKNGTDYTLTYSSGRKNTGKYAVKITFKGNYSGTKMLYFYILPGKTSKLATAQTATSIKAAWKAVAGASGYLVTLYGSDNKAVKSVYTARTSYTFSKLASGTVYKVRVTAYKTIDKKNALSKLYAQLTTATAPGAPTLKATAGTKKVSLSWNKQNGATGYVVYMSTSKNGKYSKVAVVKGNSAVRYTKTGLSTGNTYYFKVAAYKTCSDKNVYGSFSAVQGVKVK